MQLPASVAGPPLEPLLALPVPLLDVVAPELLLAPAPELLAPDEPPTPPVLPEPLDAPPLAGLPDELVPVTPPLEPVPPLLEAPLPSEPPLAVLLAPPPAAAPSAPFVSDDVVAPLHPSGISAKSATGARRRNKGRMQ